MNNSTIPDLEVLGEWDHGISDPIVQTPSAESIENMNSSLRDMKTKVLQAEHAVEGAARVACHKVDDVVRDMIQKGMQALGPDRVHVDEEPEEIVNQTEWMHQAMLVDRA